MPGHSKQVLLASVVRYSHFVPIRDISRSCIRVCSSLLLVAAITLPAHGAEMGASAGTGVSTDAGTGTDLGFGATAGANYSSDYPSLQDSEHPPLQDALVQGLADLSLTRAVANNQLAVTVIDITDRENPLMAEVNGDMMMYSASLPKIAILLGAMQKIEDGELELTDEFENKLTRMIRNSSNKDASDVYDMVGAPYLAELLQSENYQLYKKDSGGLWVGRPYSRGPVWKRDPINNISHGASSHEVARFYYMLATDRLVSAESCEVMRDVLSEPAIKHKFVSGLKGFPDAEIMRKSGTWRTYHSDSAIVSRSGREYIVVALANSPNGTRWLEQIALMADKIVFSL